jgi:hypothetical protein
MELSEQDYATLKQLEEDLWRAETRFDLTWMDKILAPGFFEFGRSGRIYSREECLAFSWAPIDALLPLPDFQARLIHPDVAQVTYNSAVRYDGIVQHARRSSLWSRTLDGWQLRFHQGTPFTPVEPQ